MFAIICLFKKWGYLFYQMLLYLVVPQLAVIPLGSAGHRAVCRIILPEQFWLVVVVS